MKKELDIQDITFLSKDHEDPTKNELLESLKCTPVQTGLIMNHIDLIEDNMLIGYHKDGNRVFILNADDDGLIEIKKKVK